jgi:hypothetical protein
MWAEPFTGRATRALILDGAADNCDRPRREQPLTDDVRNAASADHQVGVIRHQHFGPF